jgi:hypothetical protein
MIRLDPEQRAKVAEAKAILRHATERAKKLRPRKVMPTATGQRSPRERDNGFLAYLRRLPCIAGLIEGGCSGPIEAAHLRFSSAKAGRVNPGKSAKPSDKWATPLCRTHHQSDQHRHSERSFWERLGVDPDEFASALYAAYRAGSDGSEVVRAFSRSHQGKEQ